MMKTLDHPREDYKPHVPRIEAFEIPKEFIGAVIGPGGKIIQGMQEETGATITIDEVDGVGKIQVSAPNKSSIDAAVAKIRAIVAIPEVGEVYDAKVVSIMPYGCFVEFMPSKEGLLHISEISWERLETVEEAGIKEGDKIQVKLLEIDQKTGKFRLSHKVLTEKPEGYEERPARPSPSCRMANVAPSRTLNPTRVALPKGGTPAEQYPLLERFKQRVLCRFDEWCISGAGCTDPPPTRRRISRANDQERPQLTRSNGRRSEAGAGGKSLVCSPYRH